MPTAVSRNPLVAEHHTTLLGLTAALKRALRSGDMARIELASAAYRRAFGAVVDHFSSAAISLNADYYEAMRSQAGISDGYRIPFVDTPSASAVSSAITEAGPSRPTLEGFAQKLVMTAGSNELIAAIEADTKVRRWARVTRPNACSFCRMLATRGAVYRTPAAGSFIPHPGCQCTIEPVFSAHYEPPAHTRADQVLWSESTDGEEDKLNAFRRAVYAQQHP